MNLVIDILIIILLIIVIYPYFLYPIYLFILSQISNKKVVKQSGNKFSVSIVIPRVNNLDNLKMFIQNLNNISTNNIIKLELLLPNDVKLDKNILTLNNSNINFIDFGKTFDIKKMLTHSKNEIIIFADEYCFPNKEYFDDLILNFSDTEIMGVLPNIKINSKSKNNLNIIGEKISNFYHKLVNNFETKIDSAVTLSNYVAFRNSNISNNILGSLLKGRIIYDNNLVLNKSYNANDEINNTNIFKSENIIVPSRNMIISQFLITKNLIPKLILPIIIVISGLVFFQEKSLQKDWNLMWVYLAWVSFYSAYVFEITDVKFPLFKLPLLFWNMIYENFMSLINKRS